MKTLNYFPWVICCFASIGCKVGYDITMKPIDGGLERTTAVTGSLKQFEKDSLTNVFGEHREERMFARKTVSIWEGVVNAEWDDGIGGLGSWTELTSPLGSVEIFMESFGGNASIAQYVETLMFTIEAGEREVQKHLEDVLANDPLLPKVQTLLKGRILSDIKDLVLMVLSNMDYLENEDTLDGQPRNADYDQIKFFVSFLWQRGWITDDKASLYLISYDTTEGEPEVENIVGIALGLDKRNAQDAKQLRNLIEKITPLFSNEYTKGLWEKLEETIIANGYDLHQFKVTNQKISRTIGFEYELIARIETETKPVTTNGVWDEPTNTLRFTMDSIPQGAGYFNPPTLWYAAWEFPIIKYQEKIFGNKILFNELMHFNVAWDEGTETTRSKVNTFLTLREQDRAAGRPWKTKKILSECMIILRNFNHDKDK